MDERIILYILQITMIYNAISLGWNIKKISNKKYELTKTFTETDNIDLDKFVDTLLMIHK